MTSNRKPRGISSIAFKSNSIAGNRRGLRGDAHWRRSFRALHQSIFRRVIGVRRAFSHCVSRAERCWAVSVLCCALPDGVFGFAQVGERLKPTDCKSVPLRRYGGSNPPLCTRVAKEKVSEFQGCKVSK